MMVVHEMIDGKRWAFVLDEGEQLDRVDARKQLHRDVPRAALPLATCEYRDDYSFMPAQLRRAFNQHQNIV